MDETIASRKPDARIDRTREALRAALIGLLVARDYEEITVREIAARAGTSYATFFRHYRDKAELLDDIVARYVDDVYARIVALLSQDDPGSAAIALCLHVDRHRETSRALFTSGITKTVHLALRQSIDRLIGERPTRPANRLPGTLATGHPINAIIGIIGWWLTEARQAPVEEVAALIDQLVLTPVARFRAPMSPGQSRIQLR